MNDLRLGLSVLWYLLGALVAVSYAGAPLVGHFVWPIVGFAVGVEVAQAVLGLAAVVAAVLLVPPIVSRAWKASRTAREDGERVERGGDEKGGKRPELAYPQGLTPFVGVLVLLLVIASVAGLFAVFPSGPNQAVEIWVALFAAGIGSGIATILAYLLHVSELRDFDPAYAPWYIGRPVMGALLGVVFYFLLKGGILALTKNTGPLDPWALAGTSALVGLFSKNALEKLREVFNTLFQTGENHEDETQEKKEGGSAERLPPAIEESVRAHFREAEEAGAPGGHYRIVVLR